MSAEVSKKANASIEMIVLQPWFLPRSTYHAMARLISRKYVMKLRYYFDRYGCLKCERRDRTYGSNGMCSPCATKVSHRLKRCLKSGLRTSVHTSDPQLSDLVSGAKMARGLLRDLIPRGHTVSPRQDKHEAKNPVYEAASYLNKCAMSRRHKQNWGGPFDHP